MNDEPDNRPFTIPSDLALAIVEKLRLAHVYVLKDSHPEELPEDFKPHKWNGYEVEFAEETSKLARRLLNVMSEQRGLPTIPEPE